MSDDFILLYLKAILASLISVTLVIILINGYTILDIIKVIDEVFKNNFDNNPLFNAILYFSICIYCINFIFNRK